MSQFLRTLATNARSLPSNLWGGLRIGESPKDETPTGRMRRGFYYHLHPIKVTDAALAPTATFGLGIITLTLLILLTLTGLLLMLYYVPSAAEAYPSIQDIEYAVTFGGFTRALHRWTAHAMVVCIFLHGFRVVATAAYRGRELNWNLGLTLGVLTLALAFTGYLLPWDQTSYWAVKVSAGMLDNLPMSGVLRQILLGGPEIGQATLVRFYTLHVALLPAAAFGVVALHLWRVRRDGGLAISTASKKDRSSLLPAWPHLVYREAILIIVVTALFVFFSTFVDAPLGALPDLRVPDNPEKAPWYFLGLQEMVSYSATVGVLVFPLGLLGALALLPFFEREQVASGKWIGEGRARWAFAGAGILAVAGLVVLEGLFGVNGPGWLTSSGEWLNPATGMLIIAFCAFVGAGLWTGSTRAAWLAAITVLAIAVIGFTLIGLMRGPDWQLFWPWEATHLAP